MHSEFGIFHGSMAQSPWIHALKYFRKYFRFRGDIDILSDGLKFTAKCDIEGSILISRIPQSYTELLFKMAKCLFYKI